jgi:hypothetical protein
VGTFGPDSPNGFCGGAPALECIAIDNVFLGNNVNFDLDLVVVTRHNQLPSVSRIAVGARGLFEKRFFREKAGRKLGGSRREQFRDDRSAGRTQRAALLQRNLGGKAALAARATAPKTT